MTFRIEKVAVIGAGTMGGGIAAHVANTGRKVVLLDILTPNLSEEERDDPEARNRLVNEMYRRMARARPANLARADRGDFISVGNIEDDLEEIADCDWIVEVIIEQLQPKRALMEKIEALRRPDSIVSSNTSGIPIHEIAAGRSKEFRAHFLGTHFFNPPRYLKLLELIPTSDTDPKVLEFMTAFGRDVLGKGVVVCKDTPNFIGNRFFAVSAAYALEYALENGYTVAEIDAITGPLVGRPKTATYRLLDLVGLDVMGHVNSNLYDAIPDDPYRDVIKAPQFTALIERMLENNWLGNKSGQGFYKKEIVEGKREFWTLDPQTMEYQRPEKVRFDSVGKVRRIGTLAERLPALLEQDEDRAVRYLRDTLYFTLAYAAHIAPEIAYKLSDVDDAVRWGFVHEAGPFEIWDMLGVPETVEKMQAAGLTVADWVLDMLAAGNQRFYENGSFYDFESEHYQPKPLDANVVSIDVLRNSGCEVEHNLSASLLDMGDGVALLEMHSPKINAIDPDFLEMAETSLARLDSDFDALVIGNQGQDFCIGANIGFFLAAASQGMWDQMDQELKRVQQTFFDLRHAPKPVITAPHQRVLGGGVELTMAGWASVADHETYMGQVEVGVGIIPAGGGVKELLRRKVNPVMRTANADVLPVMEEVFTQLATGTVGTSAWEDKELGYLLPDDVIVMNGDHRLGAAKRLALKRFAQGARPPEIEKIYAAGRDVLSALKLAVQGFEWAGYASEHDGKIARKLAYVLCGGDLSAPTWVDPWHILDLEREITLSLLGEPLTQARMVYMLENGKPLRN